MATNLDDTEKGPSPTTQLESTPSEPDLDEIGEVNGYIVDVSALTDKSLAERLKLAPDGHTILIPQPSDDPNDPLNWSWQKKHITLIIIGMTAFLPDYGSATGAVALIPQSKIWGIPENTVNHSQAGNVFMLGPGGLATIILAAYFGRLPVLFFFVIFAFLTAAWCAAATSFDSFMTARVLNGFFSTVAQGGGLMFIKDIFFFHEHPRKINIWAGFVILSPYLGPLFTAFILNVTKWNWGFWLLTMLTGLCLILITLFVDETFYNRRISAAQQPVRKSRWLRLVGIEQWKSRKQRSTLWQAFVRPWKVLAKPTVLLSMTYYCFTFAWAVGINTTLSIFVTPLYGFGLKQVGFFYFTPVVATLLGEFAGHWLHDLAGRIYMRRHNGVLEPEGRLSVIWLGTPFVVSGLVLIGFCLENGYHYMLTSLAWGLYVFGLMIITVAIASYNLDSYPEGSGEVGQWLNQSRTLGGFTISYVQVQWAQASGTERSFGVQAGVCAFVFFIIVFLQIYGKRLRTWSGRLNFKTN
ncbi:MFS general substrate transporter [Hyaloscypha variabilis F]|uniref:MFS general substrate transporter n=1 Tax=Hyaloscypha variabilis (strain UAMH 11265 / GT02V1 / F) TaxID=1149755 RepID=A0A2J6RUU2_HYAVF|nr:MFS general substrate transporter [Hyaloscypha variabilis F]